MQPTCSSDFSRQSPQQERDIGIWQADPAVTFETVCKYDERLIEVSY